MTDSQTGATSAVPKQAIAAAFQTCASEDRPAFIPYITAGYPSVEATLDIALALQEEGAAILELGFPYSDPLADGPVIQASSQKAMNAGMTFSQSLKLVQTLRQRGLHMPIIAFTYYNPVLQYGIERFVRDAIQHGANGIIVPDLPREEAAELLDVCRRHDFAYNPLVAPTSRERLEAIVSEATGFVYCVSSLGVTGMRDEFAANLDEFLHDVSRCSHVPLAVGFGISKREQVEALSKKVQGIVIGSGIIKQIADREELFIYSETPDDALVPLKTFVKQLFSR